MGGERVFVGLGANLGASPQALCATLQRALQDMTALPGTQVQAVSSFWRSVPVDAAGPDYVNAVAELQTTLEPLALLHALQRIEVAHGRERPYRNAPRTLDLDLLLHGERLFEDAELTLPHARLHERAFVLLPLEELAPDLVHPRLGSLAPWRQRVADQALQKLPAGDALGL